jgi:aspartyl-tRNA(Asn)/glutamyl-tRNA(Gln) amidotransferase subunit B
MEHPTYEAVIGLEVHLQLKTQSKAYSSDPAVYGEKPNTQVSPISLGHPGTLPRLNAKVVDYAILLGLACGSEIRRWNEFARKNYFYADLPKGYQITQHTTPICTGGQIHLSLPDGREKTIGLTRIHMEEDAGKSLHDLDPFYSLIDLNRAGVPLLEIVSEPDFRSGEEAYAYLTTIRRLARYLDISDGNMEEGSLRCDVNVSIRPKGREAFGTKVEVKNMNSFRNVQKAIDYEIERQAKLLDSGGIVLQETRNFDAVKGMTIPLRSKEEAHDYRYFPEPDLQPVVVSEEKIASVKSEMPKLPWERLEEYTQHLGLSTYDAGVLTEDKEMADFFEAVLQHYAQPKTVANLLNTQVRSHLNQKGVRLAEYPLKADRLAELLQLIESGQVSYSVGMQRILPLLEEGDPRHPEQIAREENLLQESNSDQLRQWVEEALAAYPDKVEAYKNGKKGVLGLFMGEVMKRSKGKADPKLSNQLIQEILEQ